MRALVAEVVGTALLLAAVVGSGIMGERLAGGNVAIALLANTIATGAALVAIILTFGPISGAHLNPACHARRRQPGRDRVVRSAGLRLRAGVRRPRGSGGRARDVRRTDVFAVAARPSRSWTGVERVRGDVRSAFRRVGL